MALAIFALLAALGYGGLGNILTLKAGTERGAERLARLQTSFSWLERDIEQALERPVRDEYGSTLAPLLGAEAGRYQLELTRGGWRNPAGRVRSHLQRVAYGVRDGQLIRAYWNVLDRAQDSRPQESVLLDGVVKLELRFLAADLQWYGRWPAITPGGDSTRGPPLALEVSVETAAEGRIRRLFRVPGA